MSAGASDSAGAPGRAERSILRLVRYTPMRDVVRGRLSGRLDARHVIEAAGLPGALRDLAWEIVRRTRLRRAEKLDVARELAAHFRDAMERGEGDAGAFATGVAKSFGDARTAASLIRRAKKRNRGPVWKATAWTARVAGVVLLLAVVWYAWAAARYFTGRPSVAVDYVGQINARAGAVPEGERAWGRYRAAYLGTPYAILVEQKRLMETGKFDARPGEGAWPEVVAWVASMQPTLDRVRAASRLEHMGMVLRPEDDHEISALQDRIYNTTIHGSSQERAEAEQEEAAPGTMGTALISVVLPQVGVMRNFASSLGIDARVAAADGDGARALADVEALCSMARQVQEDPLTTLVSQMVSLAVYALALDRAQGMLDQAPDALSDDQLVALAHTLAGYQDGTLRVSLEGERAMFLDAVQRLYTDDGNGDGRLCSAGMARLGWLWMWNWDNSGVLSVVRASPAAGPVVSSFGDSRREATELYDRVMSAGARAMSTPLWQRDDHAWASIDAALEGSSHAFVAILVPGLEQVWESEQLATQRRDATLAAIALESFKRAHGSYPEKLEALVPEYLPSVPVDRYSGGAIGYRVDEETGRPLLWSVGVDRDDDGGRSTMDAPGHRIDMPGMSGLRREEYDALNTRAKGAYDGDWILFPPAPPELPLDEEDEASP